MDISRPTACLAAFAAFTWSAHAQAPPPPLLLHPETAFIMAMGAAGIDLRVDGQSLPTSTPTVLLQKSTAEADFVSAVWNDASGQKIRQREIFVVKPFYAVVADRLYVPIGVHTVVRQIILPPGGRVEGAAVEIALPGGKNFRCQANDKPSDNARAELTNNTLTLRSQTVLPAASTVFLAGTSLPTVSYVKPSNPMIVKYLVKFPNGREDEVAVSWEARPLHVGGKALEGWAACVSKGPEGEKQIEIRP